VRDYLPPPKVSCKRPQLRQRHSKHCCILVKLRWWASGGGLAVSQEEDQTVFDIHCDFDGSAIEAT